ncbi:hypothetical protein SRABI27_03660 [Pedobacter sp. Bi27]|uniref:transporter n=1 Tax=Pedobacter sp. Bi27 TaxID=2822351 RepID=UPI001D71F688|nr:transporter [Pedobacter sp. Bi27]CAH0276921.1 hypothetical protein SRABI27_03660 [Pedobacter sp. Bi27]
MKTLYNIILILALLSVVNIGAFGQQKTCYHLFRPVPGDSLREMETDRPDVTESPQTIDAGHFQFETDLVRFQRENRNAGRSDEYLFNLANIKLGLTNSTAIQLTFESFVVKKDFNTESSFDRNSGSGDLTLRLKQNLLGNDKGKFAIALLPYVKFPTSRADRESQYEGGIIIPMSIKFGNDWKLGFQVEADRLQEEEGSGHHNQILQTLTVSHPLTKKLDGIIETYYTYEFKDNHLKNFLNAALQYELSKDLLIDGGLNYGVQHDARKSYFVGLSFRL